MNNAQIESEKAQALSDADLRALIPGVPITLYKDLKGATLASITDGAGRGMILFTDEETPDTISGHWFAVLPQRTGYLVFDPYGGTASDPWHDGVKFVSRQELSQLGQGRPLLDDLFRRAGVRVLFNETPFQKRENDVNTCGRHCVVRLWNRDMTNSEYKSYIYSQGPDADATVTRLTEARGI